MTSSTHSQRIASMYRPEVDGLRALAVLVVIVNHFDRDVLPSGYLGVDIFFVISGYVITSSLLGDVKARLGDFLLSFYVRRLKRLAPALVLFVVVTSIATSVLNSAPNESLRTALAALFGLSNLRLLSSSTDYFAESTSLNAFTHTWSLGVEEQFYLLFPFVLWHLSNKTSNSIANNKLIRTIAIASAVSLALYVVLSYTFPSAAYFLMPTRLWELGAGCAVCVLERQSPDWFRRIQRTPPSIALAGLVGVLFLPVEWTVPATMAAVAITVVLIAALRVDGATYRFFTRREVVYVGLMSYSLYLWHWGVLSLSRLTVGVSWDLIPFQVALIFLLAAGSYRFVEKPLRRAQWGRERWGALAAGLSGPVLATCLLVALTNQFNGRLFLGRFVDVPIPSNLQRTWWVDRRTGKYLETCHVENAFSDEIMKTCLDVPRGKNGTVYILGDSFARNYMPAIAGLFSDRAVAYLTMGGGCAFLPASLASQRPERKCTDYAVVASDYVVRRAQAGDVVFVGQSITKDRTSSAYFDHVKGFARALQAKSVPTVLMDGTAPPALMPEQCIKFPWTASAEREGCSITLTKVVAEYTAFDALAQRATSEVPGLYYAPLRTGLCTGLVCGQHSSSGIAIWHDKGHITEEAARELAPLLRTQLEKRGFFAAFGIDTRS